MNYHCNFCFRDENEELVKHVESANFLCDICDATFSSEGKLNGHKACVIHESRNISRKIRIKIKTNHEKELLLGLHNDDRAKVYIFQTFSLSWVFISYF